VATKQKKCDPTNPPDDQKGAWWNHVAYDPEHKLVPIVVPGARTIETVEEVVGEVKDRTTALVPASMSSDEHADYESAIRKTFSQPVAPEQSERLGRRPSLPLRSLPAELAYATVHRERENTRVVAFR
jgi:hypothetical protein